MGIAVILTGHPLLAQDLVPRAYMITPVGARAVTLSYSWNAGEMTFDPSVPIDNARGRFHTSVLSYYQSYKLLGRSSNIVVSVPYATGRFEGDVNGLRASAYPSGMADARLRLSVNLHGGPAMRLSEFRGWHERQLVGISITVVAPVGQQDPRRALNIGTNRWAFKPEAGMTRRFGKWVAEGYGATWFFTSNPEFYPGTSTRTQRPITAAEGHLGYYVRPGLWASFDSNFWAGGRSAVNGNKKDDAQRESRVGFTVSLPVARGQSVKVSFSRGAFTRIGGRFQTVAVAWQYSWIGSAK
jgi:hypothetical protein